MQARKDLSPKETLREHSKGSRHRHSRQSRRVPSHICRGTPCSGFAPRPRDANRAEGRVTAGIRGIFHPLLEIGWDFYNALPTLPPAASELGHRDFAEGTVEVFFQVADHRLEDPEDSGPVGRVAQIERAGKVQPDGGDVLNEGRTGLRGGDEVILPGANRRSQCPLRQFPW